MTEKLLTGTLSLNTNKQTKSRLSESAEVKLQIFGSPGRDEMRKRNLTSLEVLAEQVRKVELQIFASQDSGSAGTELHIFGSQGKAEVRKWNFTHFGSQCGTKVRTRKFRSLAVKAERKCRSGTSGLWQLRQSRSVEAEFQIFSRQDRAEVQSSTLTVQSSWTCGSRS